MGPTAGSTGAPPGLFAELGIRNAIQVLRDYGVTPEQYATVRLVEDWRFDGQPYPDREATFAAARRRANDTGQWVEVWVSYGSDADYRGESWIVHPDAENEHPDRTTQRPATGVITPVVAAAPVAAGEMLVWDNSRVAPVHRHDGQR